jgi:hypothetical protein
MAAHDKVFPFKKIENFAECLPILALGKPAVTVFFPSSYFFLPRVVRGRKLLAKGGFSVRKFAVRALPWVAVGKAFAECL